jgi:uncharacterized integral membrane protein
VTYEEPGGVKRIDEGWRPSFGQVVWFVVVVLILVFALVNLEDSTVDFVVDQVTIPLFFVILVPSLLGFVAGLVFERHRSKRRTKS